MREDLILMLKQGECILENSKYDPAHPLMRSQRAVQILKKAFPNGTNPNGDSKYYFRSYTGNWRASPEKHELPTGLPIYDLDDFSGIVKQIDNYEIF